MAKLVGARVYHNANQAVSGVAAALAFNSERFDTDTIHDTSTNNSRLTCNTAGKYQITFHGLFAADAGGTYRRVYLYLNNTTVIADFVSTTLSATVHARMMVSTLYDLSANDYVEVFAVQDKGTNINMLVAANYTPEFMMHRVG